MPRPRSDSVVWAGDLFATWWARHGRPTAATLFGHLRPGQSTAISSIAEQAFREGVISERTRCVNVARALAETGEGADEIDAGIVADAVLRDPLLLPPSGKRSQLDFEQDWRTG